MMIMVVYLTHSNALVVLMTFSSVIYLIVFNCICYAQAKQSYLLIP